MTIDEPTRHELFLWFTDNMPRTVAEAMMKSIPPTGWGDVATREDLSMNAVMLRGEMAEVRGEMSEIRGEMSEVRGEMAALSADLNGFKAEVRGEFALIRGEIDLRFAQTNRTIVVAAIATAASSWAASFAALGLG